MPRCKGAWPPGSYSAGSCAAEYAREAQRMSHARPQSTRRDHLRSAAMNACYTLLCALCIANSGVRSITGRSFRRSKGSARYENATSFSCGSAAPLWRRRFDFLRPAFRKQAGVGACPSKSISHGSQAFGLFPVANVSRLAMRRAGSVLRWRELVPDRLHGAELAEGDQKEAGHDGPCGGLGSGHQIVVHRA